MSTLGLVGLVLVLLAAGVIVALVVRQQRTAAAARGGPKTVADLVRLRSGATDSWPVRETSAAARARAAAPAPVPAQPEREVRRAAAATPALTAVPPGEPAPGRSGAVEPVAEPVVRAVAAARRTAPPPPAEPAPDPAPEPAPEPAGARPAEPVQATPPTQLAPRAPGPDLVGDDTPWHRAALMAAGDGGAGTWQPPAPVAPVPMIADPVAPAALRLVPPVTPDDPTPSTLTGWADWSELDAEEAEAQGARSAAQTPVAQTPVAHPASEPGEPAAVEPPAERAAEATDLPTGPTIDPTIDPIVDTEAEAEPVARPLGRRTPAERAAEQAEADMALLRTFGFGDPSARPDTAPVVSMVRPDPAEGTTNGNGKAQPVRFRVVRRDGVTVADAVVTLLDDRGVEVAGRTAGTDGRGEVMAPAAGSFVLVATAPGHQPGVVAVTVGDTPTETDVLLVRSASVSGTVSGEDGPITGARVTLVQGGEVVDAVVTDADGAYRIEEIGSGEYGLSVAAAGCVPAADFVEVPDEADLRHDVVLSPASPVATRYDDAADLDPADDGMMTGQR